MNITELRPQFVDYIKKNSTASDVDIETRAEEITSGANDPAEQYLPTLAQNTATAMKTQDTLLRHSNFNPKAAGQDKIKINEENKRLRAERGEHREAASAMDSLMASAEVELGGGVHPAAFNNLEPSIFSLELHRASIQDGNGILAEPRGTLFVDTTPDQPNMILFIAPASPDKVEAYRKAEAEENQKLFDQAVDQAKQMLKQAGIVVPNQTAAANCNTGGS